MEADSNQHCEPNLISNLKKSMVPALVTTSLLIQSRQDTEPPIVLRYLPGVMVVKKITLLANANRNSTTLVPPIIITSTVTVNLLKLLTRPTASYSHMLCVTYRSNPICQRLCQALELTIQSIPNQVPRNHSWETAMEVPKIMESQDQVDTIQLFHPRRLTGHSLLPSTKRNRIRRNVIRLKPRLIWVLERTTQSM